MSNLKTYAESEGLMPFGEDYFFGNLKGYSSALFVNPAGKICISPWLSYYVLDNNTNIIVNPSAIPSTTLSLHTNSSLSSPHKYHHCICTNRPLNKIHRESLQYSIFFRYLLHK